MSATKSTTSAELNAAAQEAIRKAKEAAEAARLALEARLAAEKAEQARAEAAKQAEIERNKDTFEEAPAVEEPVAPTPEQAAQNKTEVDALRTQAPQKPVAEWTSAETAEYTESMAAWAEQNKDNPGANAQLIDTNTDVLGHAARISSGVIGNDDEAKGSVTGSVARMTDAADEQAKELLGKAQALASAPLTPTEQGLDASRRLDTEVTSKPLDQWSQEDVKNYTNMVASTLEAHKGDAEFQNSFMNGQKEKLANAGKVFGQAYPYEEADIVAQVEGTADAYGRIADALPPEKARKFAFQVASFIPETDDLNGIESGFTHREDRGGSNTFREMLTGSLSAQGKHQSAATAGGTAQVLTGAQATGQQVYDGLVSLWEAGGELLSWPAEQVRGPVREDALDGLDNALGVSEKIDKLGVGDSMEIGGGAGVSLGIGGSAEASLKVERKLDDEGEEIYVLTTDGGFDAGIATPRAARLGANVGLSGMIEYEFDNAEDAKKASRILLGSAAAAASTTAVAPAGGPVNPVGIAAQAVLLPGFEDMEFLAQNVSAVESGIDGGVGVGSSLGLSGRLGYSANAEAGLSLRARVEFENGEVTGLAIKEEISIKGEVGAGLGYGANAQVEGKFTAINRFDAGSWDDVQEALDSGQAPVSTEFVAEADVKVRGNSGNYDGKHFEFADERDAEDFSAMTEALKNGDVSAYLELVKQGDENNYEFTEEGFDHSVDLVVADFEAKSIVRDRTTPVSQPA